MLLDNQERKKVNTAIFFLFLLCLALLLLSIEIFDFHSVLTVLILAYIFFCSKIERRFSQSLVIGPFTFSSLFICGFSNIGLFLYHIGLQSLGYDTPDEILILKVAIFLGFPFRMLAYYLVLKSFKVNYENVAINFRRFNIRKGIILGWVFLSYTLVRYAYTLLSGIGDRSNIDFATANDPLSIAGILVAFSHFTSLAYLLLPLIIAYGSKQQKAMAYFFIIIIVLFNLALGNRSPILFMYLFFVLGSLFFRTSNLGQIKKSAILLVLVSLVFIPVVENYRGSAAFAQSTSISNRLSALYAETVDSFSLAYSGPSLQATGAALYGTMNDIPIFQKTPSQTSHAGWDNFEAIFYVFIPTAIMPSKPQIYDGHSIALSYLDESAYSGGFASVSFNADLYRRFSWVGITGGNFLFGGFYGILVCKILKRLSFKANTFGFLKIFILYTFYSPVSTVLTTFWIWLYTFPKYLVAAYVLCLAVNSIEKSSKAKLMS
jgi:hypothetical protein